MFNVEPNGRAAVLVNYFLPYFLSLVNYKW